MLLLLYCLYALATAAQVPEPSMLWLRGYGGNSEVGTNVSKQIDGGFIITISANTNVGNIDSFCTLSGDKVIFMKYNSDASVFEWSKCYHSSFADSGFGYIFSTSDGGYILGGVDNGATHKFLIHKENAAGTILWSKSYGDTSEAILRGMISTDDGGYILLGTTNYTNSDFPTHYGSWADDDIAVIKVDGNGGKIWSKVVGGSAEDAAIAILPAPGAGCYIVGTTLSIDHDFAGNHGGDDAYAIRMDKDGNILWVDNIGGTGGDEADCAATNGKGGLLIGGASNSTDGDRSHFPSYGCPIWILEIDSNKNILWNNCYGGGGGNCYANAICKAVDESIWVAGVSTLKGGQVDTAYGRDDAFFLHIDDTGGLINAEVLGSHQDDRGMMIFPLSNGNVIAGGFFDTSGGTFNSIWYPGSDAFLTVFAPYTTGIKQLSANSYINIYPNPANHQITIEAEKGYNYAIAISDVLGRLVYTNNFVNGIQIPVSDWQRGIYYAQIKREDGIRSMRQLIVR